MMRHPITQKGQVVTTTIESLTYQGQGVAHVDGKALFVHGAIPGDTVEVTITRIKPTFLEGRTVRILQPSPHRVVPRCAHVGVCGGCSNQGLSYPAQLEAKARFVQESLQHIGRLSEATVLPTRGMDHPWSYRNKMEFAFGQREEQIYLGLNRRGSYRDVVEITQCHICTPRVMDAIRLTTSFIQKYPYTAYDPKTHRGFLRNLVVREGIYTGDLSVNIVTTRGTLNTDGLLAALAPLHATTILWSFNESAASAVRIEEQHVLLGDGTITERIGHILLRLGSSSFIQTNSAMVHALYEVIEEYAALTGRERVLDLYCGVGAIGLFLARRAAEVIGVDVVDEAIAYARLNASLNGITHARFLCEKAEALTPERLASLAPDVVIADPPRAGLHPKVVNALTTALPPRIIYVSCNPAALARDLSLLTPFYTIGPVQPVDMFPHTWHVEAVVSLERRSLA